jgi:peptidoglycan-associated lipoprotein
MVESDPPAPAPARPTEVVREAPATVDPVEPAWPSDLQEATDRAYTEGLLGSVYFAFDSSQLDPSARERLEKNAAFLKQRTEFIVTLEGHCDERGTNEYNLALGERRASSARDYLVSLGIPASRLRTVSYGEERSECSESTETCWQRNRKAFFRLSGRTS